MASPASKNIARLSRDKKSVAIWQDKIWLKKKT
jgi:hypothetical protein